MLEVGNGGMTDTEYRTHFSMWSVMAAPLLIGADLRSAPQSAFDILSNLDHVLGFARLRNVSVQIMPGGGHGHTSKPPLRTMSRLTRGSKFRRRSKR